MLTTSDFNFLEIPIRKVYFQIDWSQFDGIRDCKIDRKSRFRNIEIHLNLETLESLENFEIGFWQNLIEFLRIKQNRRDIIEVAHSDTVWSYIC